MFTVDQLELVFLVENSRAGHASFLVKALVCITELRHHCRQLEEAFRSLAVSCINFGHANDVGIKVVKVLPHQPQAIIELHHRSLAIYLIKVFAERLREYVPMNKLQLDWSILESWVTVILKIILVDRFVNSCPFPVDKLGSGVKFIFSKFLTLVLYSILIL